MAPMATVDFYAACVTANGNGENTGDNVYTNSYSVNEEISTSINIVKNDINIYFNGTDIIMKGNTNLTSVNIFDLNGKMISNHNNLSLPASINTSNFEII